MEGVAEVYHEEPREKPKGINSGAERVYHGVDF
jgi:hypothetical protein